MLESRPNWPKATPVCPGNPWLQPPGTLPLCRAESRPEGQPGVSGRALHQACSQGRGATSTARAPLLSGVYLPLMGPRSRTACGGRGPLIVLGTPGPSRLPLRPRRQPSPPGVCSQEQPLLPSERSCPPAQHGDPPLPWEPDCPLAPLGPGCAALGTISNTLLEDGCGVPRKGPQIQPRENPVAAGPRPPGSASLCAGLRFSLHQ